MEFDHVTNRYLYPDRYIRLIPHFLNKARVDTIVLLRIGLNDWLFTVLRPAQEFVAKFRDGRFYADFDPEKINKIIASLTPGHDGSTRRSQKYRA
jgi:hypothetical protein